MSKDWSDRKAETTEIMIPVTKPFLPPLEEIKPYLEEIWERKILSNNGPLHIQLEEALAQHLGVQHLSLFCNATIALITAQQALGVSGEVITTPYSFVATSHSLQWMRNQPVFVDIDPVSLTIDPKKIEAAVTENTVAIMPLHCYGNTCDTDEIREIAQQRSLKLIYDACHSFGVEDNGGSVLRHGDISVVSFHATKVFNTFEGGLLIAPDAETKKKVDHLKNFGFVDETVVTEAGINGKMSEFNAAVGLAQLKHMPSIIDQRAELDGLYRELLNPVEGIRCLTPVRQRKRNYAYFPIFVGDEYGLDRETLYSKLKDNGIFGRRYFYPLISEFEMYKSIPSSNPANLPIATQASRRVICLPLFPDLEKKHVERICELIASGCR